MVRLLTNLNRRKFSLVTAVLSLAPIAAVAQGATSTITDGNSSLTFRQAATGQLVSSWVVDGTDQFSGKGGETLKIAVDAGKAESLLSLNETSSFASDGLFSATFTGAGFDVTVKDVLTGGSTGSGSSAINEIVTINNFTENDTPTSFRLIQVLNYNVNATAGNDTLTLSPSIAPNTADQTDPLGADINVTVTPTPDKYRVRSDGVTYTTPGPFIGNDAFRFVWDASLVGGDSAQFSINQTLTGGEVAGAAVPLPPASLTSAALLAGLGTIAIARRNRRSLIA